MNRLLVLFMLSTGISACSDHGNGTDAAHSQITEKQSETTEKAVLQKVEDHAHGHSEGAHNHGGDHAHPHSDDHEHAPETEAFYGEEAEDVGEPTENEESHQHHDDHDHDHNENHDEGDHDHHH